MSTFSHQLSLPRLPLPHLQGGLAKFLSSCRPVLTPEEFQLTESKVKKFLEKGGEAEILYDRLRAHEAALQHERGYLKGSWLEQWWLEQGYLQWREPLMIFSNWYLGFLEPTWARSQSQRAASLVLHSLGFKRLVDTHSLPTETMKDTPICMDQYRMLFSTCRIPREFQDELNVGFGTQKNFIVVMRDEQFYRLPVYQENGEPVSPQHLERQFQFLLDIRVPAADLQAPIGLLTSQHRDEWSKGYLLLEREPLNRETLKVIQEALFVVCLDRTEPKTIDELAQQVFHGSGGRNRWFDKAISIVVFQNGRAGMSGEHSPLDGTVAGTFAEYIQSQERLEGGKISRPVPSTKSEAVRLTWKVDDAVLAALWRADVHAKRLIGEIDVCSLDFLDFGVDDMKKFVKASPDALIQMALQLAFYRMHGTFAPTYESASTRRFLHGRTEAVRALSVEAVAFVKSMQDAGVADAERYALLKKACNAHIAYLVEASAGNGADRLLLGLRNMLRPGEPVPEIFGDVGFKRSSNWRLSTSNMSPSESCYPGYGPGVADGYGCCYIPRADGIRIGISSWKTCEETDSARYRIELEKALHDIRDLGKRTLSPTPKL